MFKKGGTRVGVERSIAGSKSIWEQIKHALVATNSGHLAISTVMACILVSLKHKAAVTIYISIHGRQKHRNN